MARIQKPIAVICVCFLNYFLIQKQCFMMLSHFGFMFLLKRNEVTFSPLLDISQKKKILLLITIYRASWSCQPIWAKDMENSVSKPTFCPIYILKREVFTLYFSNWPIIWPESTRRNFWFSGKATQWSWTDQLSIILEGYHYKLYAFIDKRKQFFRSRTFSSVR